MTRVESQNWGAQRVWALPAAGQGDCPLMHRFNGHDTASRAPGWRPRPGGRVVTVVVTLAAAVVTGCGAGDDLAKGLRGVVDDADTITTSKWKPKDYTLPPPASWPTDEQIVDEAVRLAAPVSDVPAEERKAAIGFACEAADGVEAANGTSADVADYVVTRTRTPMSYRIQVQQLAEDLVEADNQFEQLTILGRVTLCTWASS
jgi:hypothetical protein